MNYLFYDLETTGLCESFDQILRFAAIQADENLQELNRYEIDIKLRPDVIPSPEALVVTGLGINDIQGGLCEYDGLVKIHKLLNQPNQINLGYNSLKFDNTMLRFGFYRNLLDPYSHQYKNNTFRGDVMNINLLYFLYKTDVLEWSDKKPIKLENINEKNNLVQGKSHDAMVDVIVTLELSRKLRDYDARMWNYLIAGFIKSNDISRLNKLPTTNIGLNAYPIGLYTNIALGYNINSCCSAICIGRHSIYKNQSLWLRIDYPDISEYFFSDDKTPRLLKRKEGEPEFILPYTDNYNHVLGDKRLEYTQNNLIWLNNNLEVFEKFINDQKINEYDKHSNLDLDASIYDLGIFSDVELAGTHIFHSSNLQEKIIFLESVESTRLKELGMRIIFRNFPSELDEDQKNNIKNSIINSNSLSMKNQSRRTPGDAIKKANEILSSESIDSEQKKILDDLVSYFNFSS